MSASRIATDTVLLNTPHGSRLYGLAHAGSDNDRYVVVTERPKAGRRRYRWSKQSIDRDAGTDTFVTDLHTFMDMATSGVPQALEAMFSPVATVDRIAGLRGSFRAAGAETTDTYRRTISNFAEAGTAKLRRHALRLAVNLTDVLTCGRFDPRLDAPTAALFTSVAEQGGRVYELFLRGLCPVDLGDLEPELLAAHLEVAS